MLPAFLWLHAAVARDKEMRACMNKMFALVCFAVGVAAMPAVVSAHFIADVETIGHVSSTTAFTLFGQDGCILTVHTINEEDITVVFYPDNPNTSAACLTSSRAKSYIVTGYLSQFFCVNDSCRTTSSCDDDVNPFVSVVGLTLTAME
jgi:hypothetical protein